MYKKLSKIKIILVLLALISTPLMTRAYDVTISDDVSINATVMPDDLGGGNGGGSNGGGGVLTSVIFSGFAYPDAQVHIWKDGVPKKTTIANDKGYFTVNIGEIYTPNVLYTLYAIDKDGRRSLLLNYPMVVKGGYVTQVTGIRFAPTIAIDKTEVKVGDTVTVSGYALPNAPIDISIDGVGSRLFHIMSNADGTYKSSISLSDLRKGDYNLHVNYVGDKRISKVLQFTVGDTNILSVELSTNIPGDCNSDNIINIVDFSVAAFWYGKPNPPRCVDTNNDNIINLVDFSILAFYWTG